MASKNPGPRRAPVLRAAALSALLAALFAGCGGGSDNDLGLDFGRPPADVADVQFPSDAPDEPRADAIAFDQAELDVPCVEGVLRCGNLERIEACVNQEWVFSALCKNGDICLQGSCVKPEGCVPGQVRGCYAPDSQEVCNDTGVAWIPRTCPEGLMCVLDGQCLQTVCHPTYAVCVDKQTFKTCKADGSGYGEPEECPMSLQCVGGQCVGMCATEIKVASYLGCEYWTVDLHNWDQPGIALSPPAEPIPHAVVVSNPGPDASLVEFRTQMPGVAVDFTVPERLIPPGETRVYTMPVMSQNGTNVNSKSIRITASHPVTVSQFNPLNNVGVASNDASLLLPVNVLGSEYLVIGFPTYYAAGIQGMDSITYSGFVTVVATGPGITKVDLLNVRGVTEAGPPQDGYPAGIPAIQYNKSRTFFLNQYEVLNVEPAISENMMRAWDLTGTVITGSQPMAVFAGQECAVIGAPDECPAATSEGGTGSDNCCCDHLEEQLIPLYAWGKDYHAVRSRPRGNPNEAEYWIVMGGEDGVTVHTNPAIAGLDGIVLNKGQFKYFSSKLDFEVSGTGKLGVAQYMIGGHCTPDFVGDPSMAVFPAADQYRKEYAIMTPDKYVQDWVTIIRPAGQTVTVDGSAVLDVFTPLGSGTVEFGYVKMTPGVHQLASDQPFGVMVYGFDNAVSYSYPGGMNLTKAAQ